MDGSLGSALEEPFGGLRPESCGNARGKFLALEEVERLKAVLLSMEAALVMSIADDVAQHQLAEEGRRG